MSVIPEKVSPFTTQREVILGRYGTADWLKALVLHLWSSRHYQIDLNRIASVDGRHRGIALDLIAHFAHYGESDQEFMRLADELIRMEGR